MKKIITFLLVLILAGLVTGCGMHTSLVRDKYPKIASLSTETNSDKFTQSSFNNYFTYKTSLYCDFNISYFYSYYYYSSSQYTSTRIAILSSMLFPGKNFFTLGNIFNNSCVKGDNETTIISYLILNEFVITKSITLELKLLTDKIEPGRHRGTIFDPTVSLSLKDENGEILFDISDENSYIALEILTVENNIAYGIFKAQLVGHKEEIYLSIKEGKFWVKI